LRRGRHRAISLVEEDAMRSTRRILLALALLSLTALSAAAQGRSDTRLAYFRAVGSYFGLPTSEIAILGDWDLPADEIPVVLFVASRAGVSPEALVALRTSGRSWSELARRYRIEAEALHVPLSARASAGPLSNAYERFRAAPVRQWDDIELTDNEIIALVNVRVLSEALGTRPEDVLADASWGQSFVDVYGRLIR
jgi:hypothetical protein